MSNYKWRILINNATGTGNPTFDKMPSDEWTFACNVAEQRGYKVTLQRQLTWSAEDVTAIGEGMKAFTPGSYTQLPNGAVIWPWETFAEYDDRNPMRIAAIIGDGS